jgi:hypothetical protein
VPSFGGPATVLKYLARYTPRVAISNQRLLDLRKGRVRFHYKDYAHGNRRRVLDLNAMEFLRRFVLHVVPPGFVRIRHYGLLANRCRQMKLARCRALLEPPPAPASATGVPSGHDVPAPQITPVRDATICPVCGVGRLLIVATLSPAVAARERDPHVATGSVFDSS